jgi:hypothetical protein
VHLAHPGTNPKLYCIHAYMCRSGILCWFHWLRADWGRHDHCCPRLLPPRGLTGPETSRELCLGSWMPRGQPRIYIGSHRMVISATLRSCAQLALMLRLQPDLLCSVGVSQTFSLFLRRRWDPVNSTSLQSLELPSAVRQIDVICTEIISCGVQVGDPQGVADLCSTRQDSSPDWFLVVIGIDNFAW